MADNYMNEMVETSLTLTNLEKLNDKIFRLVAQDQGMDPTSVRGTGVIREFVPDFMKGDLCDRPERNARPFDDALEDGIILNSKNNDFGSVFESSSSTVENQKNLFSRFFDLFGAGLLLTRAMRILTHHGHHGWISSATFHSRNWGNLSLH
jgi:hypothetical protein